MRRLLRWLAVGPPAALAVLAGTLLTAGHAPGASLAAYAAVARPASQQALPATTSAQQRPALAAWLGRRVILREHWRDQRQYAREARGDAQAAALLQQQAVAAPQQQIPAAPASPIATASGSLQQYAAGLFGDQYSCAASIINVESGWNVYATNPYSGAYGIPQALPGSKMASAGADWATNGYTQLRWMLQYLTSTYGGACSGWAFEQAHGYY